MADRTDAAPRDTVRPAGLATGRPIGHATVAVVLIALAVVFAVLYRIENASENHSYNSGGAPPVDVKITLGKQYEISAPGGMSRLIAHGGLPSALNCNYTPVDGTQTRQLDTTALPTDTRTTHAVATFTGPVSGLVRIECRALGATYIDDADNAGGDPAGLFLLLCTVLLTLGAALGMSVLYRRGFPRLAGRFRAPSPPSGSGEYWQLPSPPDDEFLRQSSDSDPHRD
jgi:hypothetical protein